MATKPFTHRGKIRNHLGWCWVEQMRDGGQKYWVSAVQSSTGKVTKYRKTDGKAVGLEQWLDLESLYECR